MADPTISGTTGVAPYSTVIDVTTTTTENILSNTAASGKLIRLDFLAVQNSDGATAATIDIWAYNQDGTGMNNEAGRNQNAIGADVVAGSALGEFAPKTLEIAAAGGQVIIDKTAPYYIHEDESLVIQASAADDLTVVMTWTVIG